jgi:2-oxoglutarate dehydrogenase E2 component (dihydrolipoamide succinyltransferase)
MKIEVKIPSIGESINEVTVGQWLKSSGEEVEIDEVICEIESDKATFEIVAEDTGILTILVEAGETIKVGSTIAEIESDAKTKKSTAAKKPVTPENESKEITQQSPSSVAAKISPVAANILKTAGVSADQIATENKRITKSDALKAIENVKQSKIKTEPCKTKTESIPDFSGEAKRETRKVKMSTLRKTIARRMLEAKQGTAMLTTINEIDMSAILDIRKRYKEQFKEKYDVDLGFMSFFTKAVAQALMEFPIVNASIDEDEITYHDFCDISIAVSTDKGLVVPIVRDAEKLNLVQIERKVLELAGKARDNKLSIEEMTGGTFSITNGGVFGSLISTPLINVPQSAILGMHTIQERPVVWEKEIVIRPMMYVSLSYDHRIIDGKESVSFLIRVKEILEDPIRMLLEV